MQTREDSGCFQGERNARVAGVGLLALDETPWVDRGGKRYLWTERDVINAVVYVEYDQGEPLP